MQMSRDQIRRRNGNSSRTRQGSLIFLIIYSVKLPNWQLKYFSNYFLLRLISVRHKVDVSENVAPLFFRATNKLQGKNVLSYYVNIID